MKVRKALLGRSAMVIVISLCAAGQAHAEPEAFGGYSLAGVYSSDAARTTDEELDGSAVSGRVYAGVSFDSGGSETQVQASSGYYAYFTREDRWTNRLELTQTFVVSDTVQLFAQAAGATNLVTLERRGTDQAGLETGLRFEKGNHRATFSGAIRRRWYDDSDARSSSPRIGAEYRYRIGSWHSVEVEAFSDSVDSDLDTLDYERAQFAGYYTRPVGDRTRLRTGLVHRRWEWDGRFASDGTNRQERLWIPQFRLTHRLRDEMSVELDYRHVIRSSNDERFDRSGNRVAVAFRNSF